MDCRPFATVHKLSMRETFDPKTNSNFIDFSEQIFHDHICIARNGPFHTTSFLQTTLYRISKNTQVLLEKGSLQKMETKESPTRERIPISEDHRTIFRTKFFTLQSVLNNHDLVYGSEEETQPSSSMNPI